MTTCTGINASNCLSFLSWKPCTVLLTAWIKIERIYPTHSSHLQGIPYLKSKQIAEKPSSVVSFTFARTCVAIDMKETTTTHIKTKKGIQMLVAYGIWNCCYLACCCCGCCCAQGQHWALLYANNAHCAAKASYAQFANMALGTINASTCVCCVYVCARVCVCVYSALFSGQHKTDSLSISHCLCNWCIILTQLTTNLYIPSPNLSLLWLHATLIFLGFRKTRDALLALCTLLWTWRERPRNAFAMHISCNAQRDWLTDWLTDWWSDWLIGLQCGQLLTPSHGWGDCGDGVFQLHKSSNMRKSTSTLKWDRYSYILRSRVVYRYCKDI